MDSHRLLGADIVQYRATEHWERHDWLSAEEPLAIQLLTRGRILPLTVTMRTPGDDAELAIGLLFAEGIVDHIGQIRAVRSDGEAAAPHAAQNTVIVELADDVAVDCEQLARFSFASSACGLCGKTALEAINAPIDYRPQPFAFLAATLLTLQDKLNRHQWQFRHSGGLHAAALVAADGELGLCREDIGRHNAVDKLIGAALRTGIDVTDKLLLLSGRAGFELVQKAARASIPAVVAIGAPSSLSLRLAQSLDMTLVGFLRAEQFNLYSGRTRII